jgi:peptide/nickel transport system permease protein
MLLFIVKRLFWMLPFLVAISFLSFVLIQLPPGDYVTTYIATLAASNEVVDQNTAADLRNRFGLDQPMVVQYWKWISNIIFRGDFGLSFEWQQPVSDLIWERMALTLLLTFSALLVTWRGAAGGRVLGGSIRSPITSSPSCRFSVSPFPASCSRWCRCMSPRSSSARASAASFRPVPHRARSVDKMIDLLSHVDPVVILAVSGTEPDSRDARQPARRANPTSTGARRASPVPSAGQVSGGLRSIHSSRPSPGCCPTWCRGRSSSRW